MANGQTGIVKNSNGEKLARNDGLNGTRSADEQIVTLLIPNRITRDPPAPLRRVCKVRPGI
jgi:hypothetical protein